MHHTHARHAQLHWEGTWDFDFKSHVVVSDSEPVELLLVLVPLDAVQELPMQVILAPQRHRLVHLGIVEWGVELIYIFTILQDFIFSLALLFTFQTQH